MDALRGRGMVGEVRIVDPEKEDMQKVVTRSGPFTKDVKAVISLIPFSLNPRFTRGEDTIPVLFFSTMAEKCLPLLAVDVEQGYYELTRRVICAGHSQIAFFADCGVDSRITSLYRQGYLQAMQECGLDPVEYKVTHDDPAGTVELFRKLIAGKKNTAIVCGSLALIQNLFSLPDFSKLIPSKISLVSIGSDRIPGEDDLFVTGVSLNFDYMIQICFDLLNELMTTWGCRRSRVLIIPDFVRGNTLRVLNGAAASSTLTGQFGSSSSLYSAKQFSSVMNGR
jgi:DNA-binding LacI/PurR family transcriptional regulator